MSTIGWWLRPFVVVLAAGCAGVRPRSVRSEVPFAKEVGVLYRLAVDCYVVDLVEGTGMPLLSPDGARHYGLPLPVSSSHIGQTSAAGRITAVVPQGSIVEVVDVQRKRSLEYDIIMYHVSVRGFLPRVPRVLNGYRLFTQGGGLPAILPGVGERLEQAADEPVLDKPPPP